jgi:hypothetical protein
MGLDNTALPEAVNERLQDWQSHQLEQIGTVRVSDVLMDYDGNKGRLARDLAGIPQGGKLPAKGSAERTAYDTKMTLIGRWLRGESGAKGRKATPSPETQAKFKEIMAKNHPPQLGNFVIMGTIAYSSDVRERVIGADNQKIDLSGSDLAAFLDNIAQGNIQDAYQQLFEAYGVPGMVMQDDTTPEIDIMFN